MNIDQYIKAAYETAEQYPSWRWGQTLFNTLHNLEPELANEIRATNIDPFYYNRNDTERLLTFWDWLVERLGE